MSAEKRGPWARHYLESWERKAGDGRFPYWLRVAALAYGKHLDNGHATYKRGEVALILGSVDPTTGEITPYRNLGRSIDDAVDYGWLAPGSYWGCLIVPSESIKRGDLWHSPVCRRSEQHAAEAARQRVRLLERGSPNHSLSE